MSKPLAFINADGPLAYFIGAGIVILSLFGGLTMVAGHDAASNCVKAGGTWSHELTQKEDYHTDYRYVNGGTRETTEVKVDPHWSDKCTGAHK